MHVLPSKHRERLKRKELCSEWCSIEWVCSEKVFKQPHPVPRIPLILELQYFSKYFTNYSNLQNSPECIGKPQLVLSAPRRLLAAGRMWVEEGVARQPFSTGTSTYQRPRHLRRARCIGRRPRRREPRRGSWQCPSHPILCNPSHIHSPVQSFQCCC